nr:uncharacterized protein LOC100207311 isoform X6 [Hydra vulgaris]
MNMIKKNEYYQLCYSNEKVDEGCKELLEGKMSLNSTSILEYIFEWENIVRRRAFSDRQLQNSYKISSICKICKGINIGLKKDMPSKTFIASCCDITKESLLSYKNCQSLQVCSNCKFSQLMMLKSNNLHFTSLDNSFCLSKKYHSTHFSRSLTNSYNFSNTNIFLGCGSSHYHEILGKDRFCDMLNSQSTTFNSQPSQSVNCERLNQSYLKSNKKNEEKYKANYETQYSVLPSLSPSGLHKSKSSPQLQREKSVRCSNKVIGLEQPSSFVKTVYQYIDEDVFMLEYESADSIQVYSSGLMRHFQEIKPKLKCRYTKVPLIRTIECDANENRTFFSGRRISETSACIISTLAFISQESIKSSLSYKKEISTHLHKLRIKNGDRHCIFNRLSDWFEILEKNLKPVKNRIKPFISDQNLNSNDRYQAFCNKKVKFKKLKYAALFLSRKSQEKIFFYNKSVKRNIYSNSSFSLQKSNNFKLQKCCVDKSSLPKDNSKISTLFLKHRLSLPQPISKYGELFKNKQNKINKCDEKMSTGSIDYLDKMKSDYNENLDVFNNNINSLSQSLKSDVDSFTAKDLLSLSEQKKNSDEKNLQLDKKIIEKHDLIDLDLLHCNSMNEKLKTDSVKELSKDDLEIKRSRKGSFIGKIKRKYMGSRSCDTEYFKSSLDKNAGHSEESGTKFGIRHHSEVIIEEESKTSPKLSGNRKWKKDSKEKTNKTTEFPKESKFSTILSVFEQDNLSTDSKITKNVKSTTNIKLKSSEKKSAVIESKKKVQSNSPKKSSVPSFLTTFSPLRARKNSNNIPLQKSAEKELKELKIQQNQNRTEIDEVKPRSVSANGYYKPHKHVMIASGEISLKRKPSVIWAKVKNMEVTLVVDCDYQRFMQLKIESFEVRRVNTHKDIEELAVDTFIKHIQLLDKDALDLSSQDIKHLQLHSHEIPIGSVFDIASLNIIDHFLPCFLHLKDKHCWSLAAISYDTLFPKSFLEKYVSLIFVHNYVVFYGPSGTGKSYLARRLSHLVAHRIHENSLPIIYSNISLEKWQKIVQEISCDTSDHSKVYVLDGFTQSFLSSNVDISEILTLPQIMKSKSYVICTCTQGLTDSIPSCWQQSFKWIWLPNHEEPVDCLLQRYLRRKYIQYGNFHLQREFFRIVDWLASAWRHINSIIEKFSSSEYTIGPTMFFPCPSDILNAEEWFVDLWNYSICPYFIQTVRNGIKKYGERTNEWIDPLEMILKTYPWSCEKSKLKFIKIRMEDVGYKNNFQLSETSMTEMERLMTFLRQLELLMSESNDLFPFQEL